MGSNFNFINPYNFVPLSSTKAKAHTDERNLTGVIEYTILTKTPLFIPNTSPDKIISDSNNHKKYEFFSYGDNKPVIPASEMRGMLRSYYEILTNSCMPFVEDEVLSKRTAEIYKPGLLAKESGRVVLYSAKSERRNPGKGGTEGQEVEANGQKGYLLKGIPGPNKKWAHVLIKDRAKVHENVEIEELKTILELYKKNSIDETKYNYKEYKEELDKWLNGKGEKFFPVYYSKVDNNLYLSPAAITREVYKRKISEMVGKHKRCTSGELCPACSLFGMLNGKTSVSSRVRLSDLLAKNESVENVYEQEEVTLKELSSPKLQNVEFYVKRPEDAVFWTYDYYIDKKGEIHPYESTINGRKFYWHDPNFELENARSSEENERNATVKPVKNGVEFSGKMYFNNISKEELNELIYLLNAGEKGKIGEKNHGYKLGHAKPLGFGSIAINVDAVKLRELTVDSINKSINYSIEGYDAGDAKNPEGCETDNFATITCFTPFEGARISYPKTDGAEEIFKWFVKNHKLYKKGRIVGYGNSRTQMVYEKYMEPLTPELKTSFEEDSQENNVNNNWKNTSGSSKPGKTNTNYNNVQAKGSLVIGQVYAGKVTGHNKSGKFAFVNLNVGQNASVYDGGQCQLEDEVNLKYLGKNEKGYDEFKKL